LSDRDQDEEIERRVIERMSNISSELAHDLRSPLQTIRNAVYLIERNPENTVYYKMIKESLDQATEMLDDFRDYYRGHIISRVESDLRKIYEMSKSSVEIPDNIRLIEEITDIEAIKIDPGAIIKVFTKLLKNAVEAQPDGGVIIVRIEDGYDHVVASILDKGVGVSEEVQEVLFTPFESHKKKGKGLGLPAAKRIVESHGGSIGYESVKGEGATFSFVIPKD
jgi:two-component system sporulation sensor kinase A